VTQSIAEESAAPPRGLGGKAIWGIGAGLLLVGVLVAVFLKDIKWGVWINGANKPEYQRYLLEEEDPDLIPKLVEGMQDSNKGTTVRVSLANVLIKKNRIGEVDAMLRKPALGDRVVGFLALADKPYFRKQYVEDASWGVAATVEEWLASDRTDRVRALDNLERVFPPPTAPPSVIERVRTFLSPGGDVDLRWRAALKLASYQDCASVPALVSAAKTEADAEAWLRTMNAVLQLWDNEASPCRKDLAEADVKAIVERAFDHGGDSQHDRALRQRAMIHYRRWPQAIGERLAVLRKRLASSADPVERRVAIEALIAAKDEETVRDLPKWIHDDTPDVRSSLVQALPSSATADSHAYEGLLIGYVRDEPSDQKKGRAVGFFAAVQRLRNAAGEYVGFPQKYRKGSGEGDASMQERIAVLWRTGRLEDVTREQVVDAMWRWLARRNGIEDEKAIDEVQRTRAAFWEKAKAGDAAGARALLEKPAAEKPNLWAYERGWLMKRGG
jgi:hypothetical protein